MRGIGTSELDNVSEVGERAMNVAALSKKFASAIHTNVTVGAIWSIVCQPLVYPIHWGRLCRESLSIETPTEVISEQDVASFAVVPDKIVESRRVTTLLYHETKIDGDPLITGCGLHRTFGA
jgi:hypothetical protein